MAMAMALTSAMGALSISAKSVAMAPSSSRCGLRSSFTAPASVSSFSSSSFAGLSLRPFVAQRLVLPIRRSLVVRAKRPSLGCTKRSRSRKSRARVSGFRARIQTPTGRNVLRRRRAKGRHVLVPASNPNSGKLA